MGHEERDTRVGGAGLAVGPCGGSRVDERCEVFPGRFCAWRDIYRRAKSRGEVDRLGYMIPPRDWSLYETGSWYNYFLNRDHASHPVVPMQPERKDENKPRVSEPEKSRQNR